MQLQGVVLYISMELQAVVLYNTTKLQVIIFQCSQCEIEMTAKPTSYCVVKLENNICTVTAH